MPLSFLRTVAALKLKVPFPGSPLSPGRTGMLDLPNIRICEVNAPFHFKSQTKSSLCNWVFHL